MGENTRERVEEDRVKERIRIMESIYKEDAYSKMMLSRGSKLRHLGTVFRPNYLLICSRNMGQHWKMCVEKHQKEIKMLNKIQSPKIINGKMRLELNTELYQETEGTVNQTRKRGDEYSFADAY